MGRPLRVAHVLGHMGRSGVSNVVANLASGMAELGHEVEIVTWEPSSDYPLPPGVRHRVVHITGLSRTRPGSRALRNVGYRLFGKRRVQVRGSGWFARQLAARALRPGAFDAVYLHGLHFLPFWKLDAPRCFVAVHNHASRSLLGARSRRSNESRRRTYRRVLARHPLVAVSQGVADDLVASFELSPAQVHCVHNPFDFDDIRARAADAPERPPCSRPFLVSVGRLTAQKRFDRLIRAYAASGVPHDLVILGEGSLRADLENLARSLGVDKRVHLAGIRANPYPFLRRAELLVLSSDYEGFGNVLVESLVCGTPVISTDCPSGPSEILTGGMARGLVPLEPDPEAALADKLREAVARPPPIETSALAHFDKRHAAAAYLELAFPDDDSGQLP